MWSSVTAEDGSFEPGGTGPSRYPRPMHMDLARKSKLVSWKLLMLYVNL